MRAVHVVKGEGLSRHVLERVSGDDVTGRFSRYGVLVVPGYCHRLCRQRKQLIKNATPERESAPIYGVCPVFGSDVSSGEAEPRTHPPLEQPLLCPPAPTVRARA